MSPLLNGPGNFSQLRNARSAHVVDNPHVYIGDVRISGGAIDAATSSAQWVTASLGADPEIVKMGTGRFRINFGNSSIPSPLLKDQYWLTVLPASDPNIAVTLKVAVPTDGSAMASTCDFWFTDASDAPTDPERFIFKLEIY